MENTKLTADQIEEWRAGERRRSAYWDKRIAAMVDDPRSVLSEKQIREVEEYWMQWDEPVNPSWAAWYYRANGIFKPQYIPSNIYYGRITRALNRRDYLPHPLLQDKNYLDLVIPEVRRPEVVARNIYGQLLDKEYNVISPGSMLEACLSEPELVIKPTIETTGARNVVFVDVKKEGVQGLKAALDGAGCDYVVQKVLDQHPNLAALNPDSINTVRILSLLWNDEVSIIGALVRIGVKGVRVDNLVRSNGISCAIGECGRFIERGYDKTGKPYAEAPNGMILGGYKIPCFDKAVNLAKKYHPRFSHFKLIGWDITITPEGEPVLIEMNLDQPDLYFHQLPMGPLFGDGELLDQILKFTYSQYPMYWHV
ncbi:MAG: hypothetical protein II185_04230 [Firmicutes bacterium]|nr:hypothetical protein [Bacillota bacterium]MBQ3931298.1 hypothetical protein [Bacillota bacterium]